MEVTNYNNYNYIAVRYNGLMIIIDDASIQAKGINYGTCISVLTQHSKVSNDKIYNYYIRKRMEFINASAIILYSDMYKSTVIHTKIWQELPFELTLLELFNTLSYPIIYQCIHNKADANVKIVIHNTLQNYKNNKDIVDPNVFHIFKCLSASSTGADAVIKYHDATILLHNCTSLNINCTNLNTAFCLARQVSSECSYLQFAYQIDVDCDACIDNYDNTIIYMRNHVKLPWRLTLNDLFNILSGNLIKNANSNI